MSAFFSKTQNGAVSANVACVSRMLAAEREAVIPGFLHASSGEQRPPGPLMPILVPEWHGNLVGLLSGGHLTVLQRESPVELLNLVYSGMSGYGIVGLKSW